VHGCENQREKQESGIMTLAIINKMPSIQSRYSSDTNSGSSTPLLPDVSVSGGAASDTYSLETNAGSGFMSDPAPSLEAKMEESEGDNIDNGDGFAISRAPRINACHSRLPQMKFVLYNTVTTWHPSANSRNPMSFVGALCFLQLCQITVQCL
jgi:hypothetical protein